MECETAEYTREEHTAELQLDKGEERREAQRERHAHDDPAGELHLPFEGARRPVRRQQWSFPRLEERHPAQYAHHEPAEVPIVIHVASLLIDPTKDTEMPKSRPKRISMTAMHT